VGHLQLTDIVQGQEIILDGVQSEEASTLVGAVERPWTRPPTPLMTLTRTMMTRAGRSARRKQTTSRARFGRDSGVRVLIPRRESPCF